MKHLVLLILATMTASASGAATRKSGAVAPRPAAVAAPPAAPALPKWKDWGVTEADTCLKDARELYKQSSIADDPAGLEKEADKGSVIAQYLVGLIALRGLGPDGKDYEKAAFYLQRAADQNMPAAINDVGVLRATGHGLGKDSSAAFDAYHRAAALGCAWGYVNMGMSYLAGSGVEKDESQAYLQFKRAADLGSQFGKVQQAYFFRNGKGEVPKDPQLALTYFRAAGDAGAGSGDWAAGAMLTSGVDVPADMEEGLRLLNRAADRDVKIAYCTIGNVYRSGHGVPQDQARAAAYFRRGADEGVAVCMNNLAVAYEQGQGVPTDENQAEQWYRKAIDTAPNEPVFKRNLENMRAKQQQAKVELAQAERENAQAEQELEARRAAQAQERDAAFSVALGQLSSQAASMMARSRASSLSVGTFPSAADTYASRAPARPVPPAPITVARASPPLGQLPSGIGTAAQRAFWTSRCAGEADDASMAAQGCRQSLRSFGATPPMTVARATPTGHVTYSAGPPAGSSVTSTTSRAASDSHSSTYTPGGATGSNRPLSANHPELDASGCLVPVAGQLGRMRNTCSYPIAYEYCVMEPNLFASCGERANRPGYGADSVAAGAETLLSGAGTSITGETYSGPRSYRIAACRGSLGEVLPSLVQADPPKQKCTQ